MIIPEEPAICIGCIGCGESFIRANSKLYTPCWLTVRRIEYGLPELVMYLQDTLEKCKGINHAHIEFDGASYKAHNWSVIVGHWNYNAMDYDWLNRYNFDKLRDIMEWVCQKCILLQ